MGGEPTELRLLKCFFLVPSAEEAFTLGMVSQTMSRMNACL